MTSKSEQWMKKNFSTTDQSPREKVSAFLLQFTASTSGWDWFTVDKNPIKYPNASAGDGFKVLRTTTL